MPLFSRLMTAFRRKARTQELAPGGSSEDQLIALSRGLREDVLNALVAEGERVWDSLSQSLTEYVSRIETGARADAEALERRMLEEIQHSKAAGSPHLEELVKEAVRAEFEVAAERIAKMLIIQRRLTDANLAREIAELRAELPPKVVLRRTEKPAATDPAAEQLDGH